MRLVALAGSSIWWKIAVMLEWVCPQCDRAVDPAFTECPFCHGQARTMPAGKLPKRLRPSPWLDVERGFRFGLGFVAVVALVYFLLFLIAYFTRNDELLYRLARWVRLH